MRDGALIGERIALRRAHLGWDQMDLAVRINSDPGDVSKIERGMRDIRTGKLRALALALTVSADYLLGLSDEPTPHRRVQQ